MSFFTEKSRKMIFSRSVFIQIAVFTVLVFLTVFAFRPLQQALHRGMTHIRDGLVVRAESVIGREIRYSSIRPSLFGSFDIRNVRILEKEPNDENQPTLSVYRMRISFSLLDLVLRKNTAVRGVQLDRPLINLDSKKDRDIIELFSPVREESPDADSKLFQEIKSHLPARMDFQIINGSFNIQDSIFLYQISGANLELHSDDRRITVNSRLKTDLLLASPLRRPISAGTDVSLSGLFTPDLEEGSATINISTQSGTEQESLIRLNPVSLGLFLNKESLAIRMLREESPLDCYLNYSFINGNMDAGFECLNMVPADLFSLSGRWKAGNRHLNQRVAGSAAFSRNGGVMSYNIDIAGRGPGGSGDSFEIRVSGDENITVIDEFRFSSVPATRQGVENEERLFTGSLGFDGSIAHNPVAPDGVFNFDGFSLTGRENITAEFKVSTRDGEIKISGEDVILGKMTMDIMNISVVTGEEELGFSVNISRFWNTVYGRETQGTISLEAFMAHEPQRLEARLSIDSFSPADMVNFLQPFVRKSVMPAYAMSYLRNASVTTEIFFTTDFKNVMYNTPNFIIAFETRENGPRSIFSLSGTDQFFVLNEGSFINEGRILSYSANADFSNPTDIDFTITANYNDIFWYMNGRLLDRNTLSIHGSHGLHAFISTSNTGAYSGYFEALNITIPIRDNNAYVSFYASIRYDSKDFWTFDVDNLEIRDIAGPAGLGNLRVSGSADQSGLSIPVLHYSDGIGPLFGNVNFSWSGNFSELSGTAGIAEGPERNEHYYLDCSRNDGQFDLLMSVTGMRLDRLTGKMGKTGIDGVLRISQNSPDDFSALLNLNSLYARINEIDFQASAVAKLDADEFTIQNLQLDTAGIKTLMPLLSLSRGGNLFIDDTIIFGRIKEIGLDGLLNMDAKFKPVDSWVDIRHILNSVDGVIHVESFQYADIVSDEPFDILFSNNYGAFSVSGGPKDMLRLQLDRDGNIYAAVAGPSPVRGSAIGSIKDNFIDVHCPDIYVDLGGMWALIPPVKGFALGGGYGNAQVSIRGPLGDPEFFGSARINSARIKIPLFVTQDIRPVPFNVYIEGNEMNFGPVQATVGRGAGTASAWFRFDRWIPNIFSIEISVPRESPIPFGFDITRFAVHGDAAGKLIVAMDNLAFDISGDLLANNAEMGIIAEETGMIINDGSPFSGTKIPFVVNMQITSGPAVEFIWPDTRFPILRANADIGTILHVSADSQAGTYSINSDVRIRSGELFYFERSFYIRSGNLVFRENEQRFNPRLTTRAEVRDRTDEGPVRISLIVDNEPLLSFVPRFESAPSLSQVEIFALLGQNLIGNPDNEASDAMQRAFLTSTADLLAQFVVVRRVERQIRNFLNLDMFSVRTQVLQNAFLNAAMQNPIDRNSRVGNYFNNTTVFGGKYIGADMFIQGMLSMRYDENQLNMGGLRFEPDIGVELQSPFFSIRWDFIPAHPENWWVNDNSITLSKNWTF